jgi:hypothetical protein
MMNSVLTGLAASLPRSYLPPAATLLCRFRAHSHGAVLVAHASRSWQRLETPSPLKSKATGELDAERPSLVLVINDTKLLIPCVKCFELGISNTCDEGVCGKEWWPQDHKEMVHGQEMMIMVIKHEEMDMEQSDQGKGIIIGFAFAGLR